MKDETCAVCDGGLHEAEEITTIYEGTVYEFCSDEHKDVFERSADQYA